MAHKVGIFGIDQDAGAPRTFVKRSVAHLLVRRALAYWITKNVLAKMLPGHPVCPQPPAREYMAPRDEENSAYKAPAELPGLRFDDPVKKPSSPRVMFLSRKERSEQFSL